MVALRFNCGLWGELFTLVLILYSVGPGDEWW